MASLAESRATSRKRLFSGVEQVLLMESIDKCVDWELKGKSVGNFRVPMNMMNLGAFIIQIYHV